MNLATVQQNKLDIEVHDWLTPACLEPDPYARSAGDDTGRAQHEIFSQHADVRAVCACNLNVGLPHLSSADPRPASGWKT